MFNTVTLYSDFRRLSEDSVSDVDRKQASITRLFPTFDDRVEVVADLGGIRLHKESKKTWHFKVQSASDPSKKYDTYLFFSDYEQQLAKHGADMRNWKEDETGVDTRKLGAAIMGDVDIHFHCGCPAFQYWGMHYIATKRNSAYGKGEVRPPRVRNPREYGELCKHAQLIFDQLPFYTVTLGAHAKKYFKKELAAIEAKALQSKSAVKKGAEMLKQKMQAKQEVEPKKEEK